MGSQCEELGSGTYPIGRKTSVKQPEINNEVTRTLGHSLSA